jgi:hypothetical protein
MKNLVNLASLLIIFIAAVSSTGQNEWPVLKGPYFGQKPPGMTPELFAPKFLNAEPGALILHV